MRIPGFVNVLALTILIAATSIPAGKLSAFKMHYKNSGNKSHTFTSLESGRVSVNEISEGVGAAVDWDAVSGQLVLHRDEHRVVLQVGVPVLLYNGKNVFHLREAPQLRRGEVLIPVSALRVIYQELARPGESWQFVHGTSRRKKIQPRRNPEQESSRPDREKKVQDSQERQKPQLRPPREARDDRIHPDREAVPEQPEQPKQKDPEAFLDPSGDDRDIDVILIDPGHGGRDPGAVGCKGLHESEIVLAVAKKVADKLRRMLPHVEVVLTRRANRTVSLNDRARIANRYIRQGKRTVFISIHANASISSARYGFETFYLSPIASNAEARATAALENSGHTAERKYDKGELDTILSKMLVEQYRRESIALATAIQTRLKTRLSKFSRDRKVKRANFFVMRRVFMPSVLVEIGFLTHKKEAALLASSAHQNRIARAIAEGVRKFVHITTKKE